jgi:hypothetical protein
MALWLSDSAIVVALQVSARHLARLFGGLTGADGI